jgi:energy-converting hydrogenase A subunit R
MLDFSENSLVLIPGTKETMNHISGLADSFIVSTSYEHYIKALCKYVRFPFERTYCTRLEMDKYSLENSEKARLKTIAREIASMPIVTIPEGAKSLKDFSQIDQTAIRRLDHIFWKEIQTMKCGIIFSDVTTIGGQQKAQAIHDITKKTKTALSEVMYVGDSITDVQAFQLVRGGGGLTVSFNGNSYAVRNAEVSVMSDNNLVTAILADKFLKSGKDPTLRLVGNWGDNFLKSSDIESSLLEHFLSLCSDVLPKVQIVTQENMEMLSKESSEFRKQVRGEAVGRLG